MNVCPTNHLPRKDLFDDPPRKVIEKKKTKEQANDIEKEDGILHATLLRNRKIPGDNTGYACTKKPKMNSFFYKKQASTLPERCC